MYLYLCVLHLSVRQCCRAWFGFWSVDIAFGRNMVCNYSLRCLVMVLALAASPIEQRFFLRCRDLVRSAVPTFAAKTFLLCFAGARSRAKPQAKAPINQAIFFLRRLFA